MNESVLITGQITLSGAFIALVTVWLNHLLANTRDATNKRREQGRAVVEAFQTELNRLVHSNEDAGNIMTTEVYYRHESVIRDYQTYLSWFRKYKLIRAWKLLVYHPEDRNNHLPFYEQYADTGSLDKRKRIRPVLINRIQTLINIAKL